MKAFPDAYQARGLPSPSISIIPMIAHDALPEATIQRLFPTQGAARLPWWGRSLAAFGVPFLLYLLTLAPTIYNLDSAELTTAAATGGIVRATGYPLYLLLGRVWSLLPVGDVGFRMNLFSAVWGALTVLLAERVLWRLRVGPWATLGALGLLAVSPYFWGLSLIAEVYTLHAALMTTLILLLLRWREQPSATRLAQVGLVLGLSFGHHAATVLLLPGLAWYVLTSAPGQALAPRALLGAAAMSLLGLTVYLYLPYVHSIAPTFNYAGTFDAAGRFRPLNLQSVAGLWWLVSGRAFSGVMLGYTGAELWGETLRYGAHLWRAFFAIGIGPGLLGMVLLLRRDWRLGGMMLLMFAANAAFYVDYRVVDKELMFLPTYVVWAVWLGVGLEWLLRWVASSPHARSRQMGGTVLRGGIVMAVLLATLAQWRQVDLSQDTSTRERGEAILESVEPGALVFGWWETVPVVEYLQQVEGQRPDVQAINRFLIHPDDMEQLIRSEMGRRPIYIDVPPATYLATWSARPEGLLYRLEPAEPSLRRQRSASPKK